MSHIFDPQVLQKVCADRLGLPTREAISAITQDLARMYPGHIETREDWFFNIAGGATGIMTVLHGSLSEYLIWFGTPVGTEGFSGRYHLDIYDVAISGQFAQPANTSGSLTALDMKTGVRRWKTLAPPISCTWGERGCSHGQAQAVTVMPGVAFSGSLDGHLRAYSTIDGKIVWDFDTARDFETINGVKASGGSLNLGGATIVNGIVYVNSGSGEPLGQPVGQPGNVLLALSVAGK